LPLEEKDFKIGHQIEAGSFSEVYFAIFLKTQTTIYIKTIDMFKTINQNLDPCKKLKFG
jgi:hypothetical protein